MVSISTLTFELTADWNPKESIGLQAKISRFSSPKFSQNLPNLINDASFEFPKTSVKVFSICFEIIFFKADENLRSDLIQIMRHKLTEERKTVKDPYTSFSTNHE